MEDTSILQKRLDKATDKLKQEGEIIKRREKVLDDILPYDCPKSVTTTLLNILPIYQDHFFDKLVDIIKKGPLRAQRDLYFLKELLDSLDPYCFPILDQKPIQIALKKLRERADKQMAYAIEHDMTIMDYFGPLKDELKALTEEIREDLKRRQFQKYLVMKTSEFEKIKNKNIPWNVFKYARDKSNPKQEFFLSNGGNRIYRGTVKNNNIDGQDKGIEISNFLNGDCTYFMGSFGEHDRPMNGFINIFNKDYTYKGIIREGKYSGEAEYVNNLDGTKYVGNFHEQKKHGNGIEFIKNNGKIESHEGSWSRDKKYGTFIVTNHKGEQRKEEWLNGEMINSKQYTVVNKLHEGIIIPKNNNHKDMQSIQKYGGIGSKQYKGKNYASLYTSQNQTNIVNNQQQSQEKFAQEQMQKQQEREIQGTKKGCSIF